MTLSDTGSVAARTARVNGGLRRLVVLVCAGSTGVHAALVPEHLRESLLLGCAFAGVSGLLALAALAVRQPGLGDTAPAFAAAVLGLTAVAYLLSRTAGLPVLVPDPEQVDPVGLITTTAEVLGAAAGLLLARRKERP